MGQNTSSPIKEQGNVAPPQSASALRGFVSTVCVVILVIALVFFNLLAGCGEPKADLSTQKTHRSRALTFDYPKNWRVTEDSVTPGFHYLFVESPGQALVVLQSYPTGGVDDLMKFSKDFSESAATETPIGKMAKSQFANVPDAAGYSWIVEDFEINLLGKSVPHQRFYGSKEIGERQAFLIMQVATEDYSKAEAGFQLIRDSLRSVRSEEQGGVDQPDTAPESKLAGNERPQPGSEGRSQ